MVRPHPPATTNRRNLRDASLAQGDDADAEAGRAEEEVGEDDQEHDDNWLLEEILAEVLSADRVLRPAHDETQALVRANPEQRMPCVDRADWCNPSTTHAPC